MKSPSACWTGVVVQAFQELERALRNPAEVSPLRSVFSFSENQHLLFNVRTAPPPHAAVATRTRMVPPCQLRVTASFR